MKNKTLQKKAAHLQCSTIGTAERIFEQIIRKITTKEAQRLLALGYLSEVEVRYALLETIEAAFSTKIEQYVSKPQKGRFAKS